MAHRNRAAMRALRRLCDVQAPLASPFPSSAVPAIACARASSSSSSSSSRRDVVGPSSVVATPSRRGFASSASTSAAFDAVSLMSDSMTHLHAATGAPWFVALAASAALVRAATAPISARTIKASATVSAASALAKSRKRGNSEHVGVRDVLDAIGELRGQAPGTGAHPAWLVAGPLAQIPFFLCAVMAVRRLAADGANNGLVTGGALWFQDLTVPAVDVAMMTAPMGPYGGILPVLTAAALFANVNANFASAAAQSRGMTIVKLVLEWMTLPMLVIGMQLPQAVHCYWLTSSAWALAQNRALSTTFAREALGINALAKVTREIAASQGLGGEDVAMSPEVLELVKAAAKERAGNNNAQAVNLLLRAARGGGDVAAALRGEDLGKSHPTVLFALGQTYAVLKEWKKSALTYEYSARAEPDPLRRSRALMGAGVARARLGDLGMASEALYEANRLNPTDASVKVALASALKLNGDPERALEILREAAELQPDIDERYVKPLERELASRTSA